MSEIADTLARAAELIAPEGAWTQGYYARDVDGRETHTPRDAVCYCSLGAIGMAARGDPIGGSFGSGARGFLRTLLDTCIAEWNDAPGRKQAEVVAKFREAAALAREQGI